MAEKKEHFKSVRMTKTVFEYVESFSGDGFNAKFENLVLFCMEKENVLKERIAEKQTILDGQNLELAAQGHILNKLKDIGWAVDQALRHCDALGQIQQ